MKQINDKKNEVKSLVNDGKLDKAKAAKEELKELQNRFDLLYDLDEDEQGSIEDKVNKGTAKQVGGEKKVDKKNLVKAFVNIVKAGFLHREADEADVEVGTCTVTKKRTIDEQESVTALLLPLSAIFVLYPSCFLLLVVLSVFSSRPPLFRQCTPC